MKHDLEGDFLGYWRLLTELSEPEREYKFVRGVIGNEPGVRKRLRERGLRDWRFDFAWPEFKVAVEMEGGTWVKGAHVRGKHFRSDCEKYNFAQSLGWLIFRLTGDMLDEDPIGCIDMIKAAIGARD